MKKGINLTVIALVIVIILIGLVGYGYYLKANQNTQNPIVTMEVEEYGTVKLELYPDIAPDTVANFIALANNGYYNGKVFHRVVKDFMVQGGSNAEDSTIGPKLSDINKEISEEDDKEYCIKGEFYLNGHKTNTLRHEEGVISMARGDYSSLGSSLVEKGYNSANGQFFIVTKNTTSLNGNYAAFGRVIEGMDVVHAIENVELEPAEEGSTSASETPKVKPVIKSITVETFGTNYGLPETQDTFDYNSWLMQYYGG